jgi:hypothetical protein
VCDLETTKILVNEEEAKAHWGAIAPRKKKIEYHDTVLVVCSNIRILKYSHLTYMNYTVSIR